jgi:hypothetical protein
MVSIQRPSQAAQVASNAWLWAHGGCIFACAPNAATSAAVIRLQISMQRNITPLQATRSSRASSRASSGFTTIVQRKSSRVRSLTLSTPIHWINRCRDRPERCPQTGKRCLTYRGDSLVLTSGPIPTKSSSRPSGQKRLRNVGLKIGEQSLPLRQSVVIDVWISGSITHIMGLPEWESSNERTSRTEEL